MPPVLLLVSAVGTVPITGGVIAGNGHRCFTITQRSPRFLVGKPPYLAAVLHFVAFMPLHHPCNLCTRVPFATMPELRLRRMVRFSG
jgi:hypothetical protein